ncbi:MAG: aldehyde dehydrogenase family protein, partial [Planktomarina sp.]|nr:aldehyde dehydrogenase family protein [Planktomarina sp.]
DWPGFWITPAIFSNVTDDMTIACEEMFGPILSVLEFDDEAEVLARANNTQYGLAAGVFTLNLPRAHRMVKSLDAGTCYINTYNDAPVEAPFGGKKLSGIGRENSKAAINHYSQLKSVYVKMSELAAPY